MKYLFQINPILGVKNFIWLFIILINATNISAQVLPSGFSLISVAGSINNPSVMKFAPDGRIFVCQQSGELRVIKNGTLLTQPFVTLNVDANGERGLVGIAFDPNFINNQYIYLYYTLASGANNRISRFTAIGDVALAGSEVVILNLDPLSSAQIHNGGTMAFGIDGKLYVGVGENGNSANAQDLTTNLGKILRINSDGTIPLGNPFTTGNNQQKSIWAYGLRNPFTISIQPVSGKIFVNDVGQSSWEEINDATSGGLNFGWPTAEGVSNNSSFVNPVYTYAHGSGSGLGCAITGGTFFNPATTNYPSQYIGNYFFLDYCGNWIDRLSLSGTSATRSTFASSLPSSCVGLITGPDGNFYFLGRDNNSVYKIIYTGTTSSPVITSQPQNSTVLLGNSATFSVSVTGTTPLTYRWRKNGINIANTNSSTYTIATTTSSDAGTYSVMISNSFGSVTSIGATLTVNTSTNNNNPVATISTPINGATFSGGNTINFSGSANDTEDGSLPASAFRWVVELHHNTHVHPGPTAGTGIKSGSFTIPNIGETSANIFFRLYLIVTDSQGAIDTAFTDILPITSLITLNSNPQGLTVTLDGQPFITPYSVLGVEGMIRTIGVVDPQQYNGFSYQFQSWSVGGNATQSFATSPNDVTYTASFSSTFRDPENPSFTVNGLDYNFYKGSWSVIPDFSSLPIVAAGNTNTFELSQSLVSDNFGFQFRGFVNIPVDGNYTFYTSSDDGSKLYIGSQIVVDNDGLHGTQEVSGSINLRAGKHAIRVDYFERTGAEILSVSYSSSSIIKQVIPDAQLYRISSFVSNVDLQSTGDAYVTGGTFSNVNYGTKKRLNSRKAQATSSSSKESYLKFDLFTISTQITNAKLKLFGNFSNDSGGTVNVKVEAVANQSWDELLINYSNKPSSQAPVLASTDITNTLKYYEWDVTSFIQSAKNAGLTSITFKVSNTIAAPYSLVQFYSRENISNFPLLKIISSSSIQDDASAQNKITTTSSDSRKSTPNMEMIIYPNPANDNIHIEILNTNLLSNRDLFIYSLDGKIIKQLVLTNNILDMSTKDLMNGTYLFCIKQNDQIEWKKISVSH